MSHISGQDIKDIIAWAGAGAVVQAEQLRNGRWRAYLYAETDNSQNNPRAWSCPQTRGVVRDNYGYILNADNKEGLLRLLQEEYPHWRWEAQGR